jgi:hypothetical protein
MLSPVRQHNDHKELERAFVPDRIQLLEEARIVVRQHMIYVRT